MKKKKKIYLGMTVLLFVIYLVLLTILCLSEHADSHATIRSFRDAFWYSLVTLTTVGYGDLTPITPLGQAVGVIFLLMSAGIMMTLFGAVISFVTSEGLPMFLLGLQRRKHWYYFADYSEESSTLAENIYKEDADTVIIFGQKRDDQTEFPNYPCLFINVTPARIVAHKKNTGAKCKIFLMKENDIGTNTRAIDLHLLPVDVYARTTNGRDRLSGNINFFHSYDCCARQYWHSKPLCKYEHTVIIIGFGNYGRCILERAIMTNILAIDQHVAYHIFGNTERFLAMHDHLHETFSLNTVSETTDSLIFHDGLWEMHHTLIAQADRIIICPDDETEGWNIYWRINSYYDFQGQIHLHSSRKAPGVSYFGTNEEIYTPDQIMRTALNRAAITINDIFCRSVSYPTRTWDELDDFHRQSKIAAADHILMKIRILLKDETLTELTPEIIQKACKIYSATRKDPVIQEMYRRIDHTRWLRFYTFYNWRFGPVRDDSARQHPMLCPYEHLTPEQKRERDVAWELLESIATDLTG